MLVRTLIAVLCLLSALPCRAGVVVIADRIRTQGMIGWWTSKTSVSATNTWYNNYGANNATLAGNAYITAGTGMICDGTGDYAQTGNISLGAKTNPITTLVWSKTNQTTAAYLWCSFSLFGNPGTGGGVVAVSSTLVPIFDVLSTNPMASNSVEEYGSTNVKSSSVWYQTGYVHTGACTVAGMSEYVNGGSAESTTSSLTGTITESFGSYPLTIGGSRRNLVSNENLLNGTLDNLRIYQCVMSQEEIAQQYRKTAK